MSSTSCSFVRLSSRYENDRSITLSLTDAPEYINQSRVMFDESKWDDRSRSGSISKSNNQSINQSMTQPINQSVSQTIKQSTRSLRRFNTLTQPSSPSNAGFSQSFFPINQSINHPLDLSKYQSINQSINQSNPLNEVLLAAPAVFDSRDRSTSAVDADMLYNHQPFHQSINLSNNQLYNQSINQSMSFNQSIDFADVTLNIGNQSIDDGIVPIYDDPNDLPINQSINQSINQPINQSTNQNIMLITRPFAWSLLYYVTLSRTLFMLSLGTAVYHLALLYAGLYGLYLVLFTSINQSINQSIIFGCYFGFICSKSIVLTLCVCVRVRFRELWVNQWNFRIRWSLFQRVHYIVQRIFAMLSFFVSFSLFISLCVNDVLVSDEQISQLIISIICTHLTVTFIQSIIALSLIRYFHIRFISFLTPFIPISRTFNSSAREAILARAYKDAIKKLPSKVFRSDLTNKQSINQSINHTNNPSCNPLCSVEIPCCCVCLSDFEDGDVIRELKCLHEFHRECIDAWLSKRLTCPLCVQGVSRTPSHIKRTLNKQQVNIQMTGHGGEQD